MGLPPRPGGWCVAADTTLNLAPKPYEKPQDELLQAQSPPRGAELVGLGSLAPASALDAVAKSQPSLNANQLGGLESCPDF